MRTVPVELLDEIIELALLLKTIETWRACRFLLEREMHPFVSSILLGMTRPDGSFRCGCPDESHQTERRLRLKSELTRGEGDAIIGTNRIWQTTFLEQTLEGCDGQNFACRFQSFAREQIARGVIRDRQGVAVFLVAQQELTLVIGAPEIV